VAQRSLMTKIRELQRSLGFAVIFVTHDMSVVSRYSDRVLVMYAGQVAEAAETDAIFERPLHPYTRGLMNAFPSVTGPRRDLAGIPGSPPDLARPPAGCRFHPRCPEVMPACLNVEPDLYEVGAARVRCLLYTEHAEQAQEAV
jgi:peptide/nickel transport system ATP-binding protein